METGPVSGKQKEEGGEKKTMRPTAAKQPPRAGVHSGTPGPVDAPGAWAQPDRAHPVSAGSSVPVQEGRHRLPSPPAAPSHSAASRWHLIN